MTITQADKELALRIARELEMFQTRLEVEMVLCGENQLIDFAHRYHTAKLEQAAKGFEEFFVAKVHQPAEQFTGADLRDAWEAGAASQQPAIAALTEEVERLKREVEVQSYWGPRWEECHKQLQSAQLDNKRLWDSLEKCDVKAQAGLCYFDISTIRSFHHDVRRIIADALSTPPDTSAADELQSKHDHWKAEAMCYANKLTAAQLAAKTLQEQRYELMGIATDVDARKGFDVVCRRTLQRVIDNLSTPLDTSAADDLLARVKELEVKLRMEEELHHVTEAGLNQSADQLIAARYALEEARKAMRQQLLAEEANEEGATAVITVTLAEAIATITRALGEEQKKEG